jgi:hypothetical protein
MSLHFKGTTALTVENVRRQWSEANGWESVYTYKGPWSAIDAAALNTAYVGNASRIDVRQEPGNYGVLEVAFASIDNTTASTTTADADTDNWTFQPYKVQRNVWEHDYFDDLDATIANGSTAIKQRIISAVDAYKAKAQAAMEAGSTFNDSFDVDAYTTLTNPSTQRTKAIDLAQLLLFNKETYEASKYSLRNSLIVPANSSLFLSHYRTGYQWTTNRLVDLILTQKTDVTKYAICGDLLATFQGTYWLKEAPSINELNGGKFEIVQEFTNYISGELSYLLYPYHS